MIAVAVKELAGVVPAAASIPARRRLGRGLIVSRVGQEVISAQVNPASSRAAAVTASGGVLPWVTRCM